MTIVTLSFLLATAALQAERQFQQSLFYPMETGAFSQIAVGGDPENSVLAFGVGLETYTLSSTGEFRRYQGGVPSEEVSFPVKWDGYPEAGWYFWAPEGLYLALEMSDAEVGWTELYLMAPKTLAVLERREFPAFNFGPAMLTSGQLFVGGSGFLAALDRDSLTYDWCHWNLYRKYKVNSFVSLELRDKHLTGVYWDSKPSDLSRLRVGAATGEILDAPPVAETKADRPIECPSPVRELE